MTDTSVKKSLGLKRKSNSSLRPKVSIKRPKLLPPIRLSDQPPPRKPQWTNRERVLVISSRGVSYVGRHLMKDLLRMMPHGKTDSKLDHKKGISVLNELAEMSHTNKVIYFEARKKKDLYLWLSCVPNGPSIKFLVENIRTTAELKLTGNCLKSSRPVLAFDPSFEESDKPHINLIRELFIQTLGTPNHHPRSQPYIDKTFTFVNFNDRIWFRVYQIAEESGALVEVGEYLHFLSFCALFAPKPRLSAAT
ncbi:Ribosome biogenesis protein BRX1 isoform 1 [Schistosoma japonicum]|uniref:Ribosome biogenesis protein BRX1 homolog n=1 Tax=Schistosoma japonicum TaxID=6182 RepID=A0A4Z2D2Y3_SCHJA|nr:Ribosome biogenesis protein BRX1 like [Schistosoma japonicum]TNN10812.1 Ribosome biogenesis protein BRX1 isoform 1 [Schistosoma japonicum]